VKALLKLVVFVLMANALWRVGSAYASFYRFRDSVRAAAMDQRQSDDRLRQKILELASTYDLPLAEEDILIRRDEHHTFVDSSYTTPVAVLPGYAYRWPFTLEVDAYMIAPPPPLNDLGRP